MILNSLRVLFSLPLKKTIKKIKFLRNPKLAYAWFIEFIDDKVITKKHRKYTNFNDISLLDYKKAINITTKTNLVKLNKIENKFPNFLSSKNKNLPNYSWAATNELAKLTYIITKLIKPKIVVETGVGPGMTSWSILKAMSENKKGHLYSIDLPTPNTKNMPEVGYLIPKSLKDRWNLLIGSSKKLLPNLLSELSEIDIFIHDSRHSFSNQMYEYETSWSSIKNQGFLISDDISNDAFINFSKKNDKEPILIKQNKNFPIGIIKK
ncbi:MAG: hypothetical protein CL903_00960 [Dehalococcoidia bacterium]|nr:hypothetical protein [Dehalococcoidia bacterium]